MTETMQSSQTQKVLHEKLIQKAKDKLGGKSLG